MFILSESVFRLGAIMTRLGKGSVRSFFAGNTATIRKFWELSTYVPHKKLAGLVQKLETKKVPRGRAVYLIGCYGTRAVREALNLQGVAFSESLVEKVQRYGVIEIKSRIRGARAEGRDPAEAIKEYEGVGTAPLKNSRQIIENGIVLIRHKTRQFPNSKNYLQIIKPFIRTFKPTVLQQLWGLPLNKQYLIYVDSDPTHEHIRGAPFSIELREKNTTQPMGFISFAIFEENGEKIVTMIDIQTHRLTDNKPKDNEDRMMQKECPILLYTTLKDHAKTLGFTTMRLQDPRKNPIIQFAKEPKKIESFYWKMAQKFRLKKRNGNFLEGQI